MTEKRFIYDKFDIVGNFEENELKLYAIDNNPSNDLDESNLFYVYSDSEANIENIVDKLNALTEENKQLKMGSSSLKLLVQNWEALDEEKDEQLDRQNQALKKLKKENEQLKQENSNLRFEMSMYEQKIEDLEFTLRTIKAFDRTIKEKHSDSVYDFKKKIEKW